MMKFMVFVHMFIFCNFLTCSVDRISPAIREISRDELLFVYGTTYDEDTGRHVADYSGVKVDAPKVINHAPEAETHDIEKMVDDHDQSLKFTSWKNENDQSELKWMSSELRLMRKMKVSDHGNIKFEDQKQQQVPSYVINHDHHQSSMINNASDYNNHPPIRVCADFNTTKTPLWGSGPKGPKRCFNLKIGSLSKSFRHRSSRLIVWRKHCCQTVLAASLSQIHMFCSSRHRLMSDI